MKQVFTDIFALFYLGNPKSPFSQTMKNELENNKDLYDKKIKYFVKKYAYIGKPYKEYTTWDFTYDEKADK